MSDPHTAQGSSHAGAGHQPHSDKEYIRIWAILLGLLVVSLIGPEIGKRTGMIALTLVTAFGIAVVKAYLVVKNFMHIGVEKRYVAYLLVTMVALMVLMVGGVGPDVLKHEGTRWKNEAAERVVREGNKAPQPGEHGEAPPAH